MRRITMRGCIFYSGKGHDCRYQPHALVGLTRFDVLEQGPAPASTVPHLPVNVSGIFHARFNSPIDLETAMTGLEAPVFAVEKHW